MATPPAAAAAADVPSPATRDEPEEPNLPEPEPNLPEPEPNIPEPEPACLEAQKWIEAVTGKSFGDKVFRSALENGILLCELLSAIRPGLVKKINRLPTPIAGLDNLSVFLRGCEELGLRGSQLFDPGDLQDTSMRANLKDSDCNRKLKNVLNTVFWLGKAASGCASYSGPTLNLKEFEGLLSQMKMETEEGGEGPQRRSVRDSGYDCWDSERSESLSPPRHTRDNSLDSLDSFGSRSQHSPSPDVVNRGNTDGRGSDSEADGRRPDVRKDDMLARRTASGESRSSIAFNQFLPNRTNASSYIPAPRRKPHTEEGEQRRSVSLGDMLNEEEVGDLPPLSQSRHERMQEQLNSFQEEEDHWHNDLARWKTRRRSTSQELIKKEEERKRMEKSMKEQGGDGHKRKSIKTYKEIVEDKERRELELCEAYRNAATPEEAAVVLQRYALRFTISDATLDSLKLPRSTSKPPSDAGQVEEEHKTSSAVKDSETSEPRRKPEPAVITEPREMKPEDIEKDTSAQQETSVSVPTSSLTPTTTVTNAENKPPQLLELNKPEFKPTESPTAHHTQQITGDAKPQTKHTPPQITQVKPHTKQLPSPPSVPSRPLPLLVAKPYCQPRSTPSGHKPVKMDVSVRLNGEATEDLPTPATPAPPQHSPREIEEVSSKQTEKDFPAEETLVKNQETTEQPTPPPPPPPQTEKSTTSSGSAISSLIGGRNCIITTTIVTELTQTLVEPLDPEQSNGQEIKQVNGTTGLFASPAKEKKEPPASSVSSMQEYSPTVTEGPEESSVTEQYHREQEKLKKEWEKAQIEVEEEERKHNEEERRILEETVAPLTPSGSLNQQLVKTETTPSAPQNNRTENGHAPPLQNGQRVSTGTEDQHASKLHFFQDPVCDGEPSKKQELWKTTSLDRNLQLNQAHAVKRSGSHDVVTGKQQQSSSSLSSSSPPKPPSPSRCVSGKRLCGGCSQPLGKGAAMIIDTLGLFFHIQCFKCGVCDGQLGDASAGTDVRIRNGQLSCYECYMATRGRGQPTTL
ncbi:LIM and calponin homology domains-containing protein 1a [Limanda limanda]|uniref:LIM and calponin homology domains-containing protein 1a n=1 Tax=Limanda limanda TaxID=27771 RepID=UPI0029C6D0E6|nr:LIM and calponin homology domains-containing protein 1a [Limanda limanda]